MQDHAHTPSHTPTVTTGVYARVAVVLAILTGCEFALVEVDALKLGFGSLLIPLLFVLTVWKFYLVAATFMHLKFDKRVFLGFFLVGIVFAVILVPVLVIVVHARA